MCEVTVSQAWAEMPMLLKKLQTGEESVVYITQNGTTIVQMTLVNNSNGQLVDTTHNVKPRRLGIGKGLIEMPKDFDKWDKDIEEMFGETI